MMTDHSHQVIHSDLIIAIYNRKDSFQQCIEFEPLANDGSEF